MGAVGRQLTPRQGLQGCAPPLHLAGLTLRLCVPCSSGFSSVVALGVGASSVTRSQAWPLTAGDLPEPARRHHRHRRRLAMA